jgi:hypothetical protein
MNIKINRCGKLEIERGVIFKTQRCPNIKEYECGDWCPLFGEPETHKNEEGEWDTLYLCKAVLSAGYGEKIIDERKK